MRVSEVLERIGSYEVLRLIARGGMATVYEGRQPALDRTVALKRLDLRSTDPASVDRFIRESRIAAAFDHPNIVTVFDFFEHGGLPYIAMEYLPRGSVRRWVGHLTPPQVAGVLEGVLAALARADARGVAHRDIKPENVLVTRRGGVKIADFGIAKAYTTATSGLTASGVAMGTPAYMAPEQAQGRPVGAFTDLYAVGAMAYELISGAPPFTGSEPMAILYRQVNEPPPPLEGCDPRIARWVARMLEKDPARRPRGAAEAWDALEEIVVDLHGPYWRRDAALEDTTAVSRRPAYAPTRVATTLSTIWRRKPYWGLALIPIAGAGALAALDRGDGSPRSPVTAPAKARSVPYDFDADGGATIVAGLPGRLRDRGAVSLPHTSRTLTGGRGASGDRYGAALASADFDGDGFADLAIGSPEHEAGGDPGREGTVTVYYGSAPGLDERHDTFRGTRIGAGQARFGEALAAGDLDRDGRGDLVAGAPGGDALQILFGTRRGLRVSGTRVIPAPARRVRRFGRHLALGDVDRDGHADLVEAGPGHATFCRGGPRGPTRCRPMGGEAVALALADVTGDGHADVVQGIRERPVGRWRGGAVLVWPGTPAGPGAHPAEVTRSTPGVPGDTRVGDGFGSAVDARDLDGDGRADLVIGVPGDDRASGEVVVVRGARAGVASSGARRYSQGTPGIPGSRAPGNRFGAGLALVDAEEDGQADLVVSAPGASEAVLMLPGTPGGFTGFGATREELAREPDEA